METTRFDIPKDQWGPGPWQEEPDRVDFEHAGLACLALRAHHGAWCGYVAVPPGHPLHGCDWPDLTVDLEAHRGVNYSALCDGPVCHTPKPGEPDNVWWFGFDCMHFFDFVPVHQTLLQALPGIGAWGDLEVYRDLAYVQRTIRRLAEQLRALECH